MAGRIDGQTDRFVFLNGFRDSMHLSLSKLWEVVKDIETWPAAARGFTKSQTQLSEGTTTTVNQSMICRKE